MSSSLNRGPRSWAHFLADEWTEQERARARARRPDPVETPAAAVPAEKACPACGGLSDQCHEETAPHGVTVCLDTGRVIEGEKPCSTH